MIEKIGFEDFIIQKNWTTFFLQRLFYKFLQKKKKDYIFLIILSYLFFITALVILYTHKKNLIFISGILYLFSFLSNAIFFLSKRENVLKKSIFLIQEKWKGVITFIFLFYGILGKFRNREIFYLFILYLFLSNIEYFYNFLMKTIASDKKSLEIYLPDFIKGRVKSYFSFILNNNLTFLPSSLDLDLLILTFVPIVGHAKIFFYFSIIFLFLHTSFKLYLFFLNYLKIERGYKRIVNVATRKNVRVFAAILGGGIGKRMGTEIPKQYLTVKDVPIFIYTIQKFENSPVVNKILVVVPKNWTAKTKEIINQYGIKKVYDIIPGGETRQLSSYKALQYFETILRDEDIVLIHDMVRPNVSFKMIEEAVNNVQDCVGAIPVYKSKDTLIQENEKVKGTILSILDRDSVYSVQTPQSLIWYHKRLS
uniref:2-C-methyl-D-erythritol 4-phosphate cytidylyltransferase n=1 Tax=candidate division WOR-3 bacterium TaxID=2052148 RepID=A0A7C4UAF2_UNCW3